MSEKYQLFDLKPCELCKHSCVETTNIPCPFDEMVKDEFAKIKENEDFILGQRKPTVLIKERELPNKLR